MLRFLCLLLSLIASTVSHAEERSIIGGDEVVAGKYKFMVNLIYKDQDLWQGHFCGGSLIRDDLILTAAHCVDGEIAEDIEVSAGRTNLSKDIEGGQRRYVSKIIIHQDYSYRTTDNDIALVYLEEPFELNDNVQLISFDSSNYQLDKLTVIGWGNTSTYQYNYPKNLMEVDVNFIANDTCNSRFWMNGAVTDNMFCAGFDKGGKDSCQGDSGGPIFLTTETGDYVQAGIVSWGEGCARRRRPGIYTKLSNYNDWILNQEQ